MQLPEDHQRLRITDQALLQVNRYARLVNQLHPGCECIGFLLGGQDDLVDSVMLAPGQTVSHVSARIDAQSVLACGREMEQMGKQPKGWWHSHGHMSPFHSETDNENTVAVLMQITASNRTCLEHQMEVRMGESGRMSIVDDTGSVELNSDAPELLERLALAGMKARRIVPAGYAYSLVVNAHDSATPHAEVFTSAWCSGCNMPSIQQLEVPLEVVYTVASDMQLIAEIEAKVCCAPVRILAAPQDIPAGCAAVVEVGAETPARVGLFSRLRASVLHFWTRIARLPVAAAPAVEVVVRSGASGGGV